VNGRPSGRAGSVIFPISAAISRASQGVRMMLSATPVHREHSLPASSGITTRPA
jgi:hypothetical protein